MRKMKVWEYIVIAITVLGVLMVNTVPSDEEYLKWLAAKYKIGCHSDGCIQPLSRSVRILPFLSITKTSISADGKRYIKVLGIYKTFIILEDHLQIS